MPPMALFFPEKSLKIPKNHKKKKQKSRKITQKKNTNLEKTPKKNKNLDKNTKKTQQIPTKPW
jgi:hypothetical protein